MRPHPALRLRSVHRARRRSGPTRRWHDHVGGTGRSGRAGRCGPGGPLRRRALVLRTDGAVAWRLDRGDLVAFSPGGGRALASYDDRLAVLRTDDGGRVTTIDLPAGIEAWSVVWETERALLALAYDAGRVAIVRLHLDGRVERATAARAVDASGGPYVLLP